MFNFVDKSQDKQDTNKAFHKATSNQEDKCCREGSIIQTADMVLDRIRLAPTKSLKLKRGEKPKLVMKRSLPMLKSRTISTTGNSTACLSRKVTESLTDVTGSLSNGIKEDDVFVKQSNKSNDSTVVSSSSEFVPEDLYAGTFSGLELPRISRHLPYYIRNDSAAVSNSTCSE